MLDIRLGRGTTRGHLTVFPLVAGGEPELPYVLMGDALAAGTLRIGEVGQGTVPALLAHNAGDADILILDGETDGPAAAAAYPRPSDVRTAPSRSRGPKGLAMKEKGWGSGSSMSSV